MGSDRRERARILIVTRDRHPPFRVDLIELFSRWLTPRFDLDWVMRRDSAGPPQVIAGGDGERFFVSGSGVWKWLALQCRHGARAARADVDLIQVRDSAFSALAFLLAAKIGRRPFVYWMSYPMAEGYLHRAGSGACRGSAPLRLARFIYGTLATHVLYRWVLPRADHVFVQSDIMKADVAAKGLAPDRITAVPMGFSVAAYDHRKILPIDDPRFKGRKVLVYVGALDPERKIEMLAGALAPVVENGFDALLLIVGDVDDADRRRIERGAKDAEVTARLVFTGRLPLAQALSYIRRADVCLAPFPVWPQIFLSATPTKLVEYLAMGRPVVANDHPDQRRVIEDSGAGVVAAATAEGFGAAILAFLRNPETADAMGARGPAWVAAHRDYAIISERVAQVYDRLLGRAGA